MKGLVVEDSRLAREGFINMLAKYGTIELIGAAATAEQAKQLIDEHRPEVIFLDIHLPGDNAFELLQVLDYDPKIIFTTAYADYAVRSFEFNTIDYLLKPVSHERLDKAIEKLLESEESEPKVVSCSQKLESQSKILVRDNEMCHLIQLSEIYYFESCKNYVRIVCAQGKPFIKKSLSQVEARLPASQFVRINRQHIINLDQIQSVAESVGDGFDITMVDGAELNASRRSSMLMRDLLSL